MKLLCLSLAILLTGCAANSGVISVGKDTYMVLAKRLLDFLAPVRLRQKLSRRQTNSVP